MKGEKMKKSNLVEIKSRSRDGVPGTVTYGLNYLEGNCDAYFSLTARYMGKDRNGHKQQFCGQCTEDILSAHPELKPFADLHLSKSNGVPMHAEANGWYWLAGVLGGLGEKYHGGSGSSGRSADECLQVFADQLRLPILGARTLAEKFGKLSIPFAKLHFHDWIEAQKPRWAKEAAAATAMLPVN
jgi:hypothetical protein